MPDFIPKEALDYIKNKKLKVGFSYKDVWNEEHSTSFTVAKAMQIDVLDDMKKAVEKAIKDGQSFESFKKNIKPTLQKKGWWGRKKMTDPLTGDLIEAQLGSDRRLKTIYDVNLRSAYQKGQYDRTMQSDMHPYLMYRIGNSTNHREQHLDWDGLILPKNDPFWDLHFPPNGFGCKCHTRAVSEARKQRYEKDGIRIPPTANGKNGGVLRVKTKAPDEEYYNYFNERKGIFERIPKGITPGFSWNQAFVGRNGTVLKNSIDKLNKKIPEQFDAVVKTLFDNKAPKKQHINFIDYIYKNRQTNTIDRNRISPVGFLDKTIVNALKKKGINISNNNVIFLQANLPQSKKYTIRHKKAGNAPDKFDWYNLMDYLLDASVFFDDGKLIYLMKKSESVYMKIAVDVGLRSVKHGGVRMLLPKIDTMYKLDIATETDRGLTEFNRIQKLEKLR